jgi:glycosyltransferase involved in cell wall biosynthesis
MKSLNDNSMPLVTCIIPTYNNLEYVYETIDSVFVQDYPNIELIIADDCSEEFEKYEIMNYLQQNKSLNICNSIVYSNQYNLGTVKNLNKAISMSHGEYFINIGGDDIFFNSTVMSNVLASFISTGAKIMTCRAQYFEKETYELLNLNPNDIDFNILKGVTASKLYDIMMIEKSVMPGTSTFYTKKVLEEYGYFDEDYRLIEDYPFYLKITRNGEKVFFSDIISTLYRHGSGVSTTPNIGYQKDMDLLFRKEIIPYIGQYSWFDRQKVLFRQRNNQYSFEPKYRKWIKLMFVAPIGTTYALLKVKILDNQNLCD